MSGGSVPTAYKYSRIVNGYTIERGSSDWFLIAANKYEIYGNARKDQLSLTPDQRDIAVSKFTAQFSVQPVVALAVAA
jgi:PIN domain nuclease of toxin-antitoxin system